MFTFRIFRMRNLQTNYLFNTVSKALFSGGLVWDLGVKYFVAKTTIPKYFVRKISSFTLKTFSAEKFRHIFYLKSIKVYFLIWIIWAFLVQNFAVSVSVASDSWLSTVHDELLAPFLIWNTSLEYTSYFNIITFNAINKVVILNWSWS